jgi:polyhydroxybutyrate depolymerase
MTATLLTLASFALLQAKPPETGGLEPGFYKRAVVHDGQKRPYLLFLPKNYSAAKPTPVVLALHGATMNASIMAQYCGLNDKASEAGFMVVYPTGTGPAELLLTWNAGAFPGSLRGKKVDDVGYITKVLEDVAAVAHVDPKRTYATGLSNGAMMCYRLAAEMSERIAAIAPIAGTLALDEIKPKRPVPVCHFHGTEDSLVPFDGLGKKGTNLYKFASVPESVAAFVALNGCADKPIVQELPAFEDKIKVSRQIYNGGKNQAEVILYLVHGGGHTWPGRDVAPAFLGRCARNISANDIMWDFFQRHPLK